MTKDQEEFDRLRKRLYALADKMGQRLTIIVRCKKPIVSHGESREEFERDRFGAAGGREPGEE